jgi:hypothetical protein
MKLISPVILESNKGNIIKYNLTHKFFKKKIYDFYFSNVNKNKFKKWKYKNNETVLIVVEGKVFFEIILKKKIKFTLNSSEKKILIIPKYTKFRFGSGSRKSVLLSLLNKKYVK